MKAKLSDLCLDILREMILRGVPENDISLQQSEPFSSTRSPYGVSIQCGRSELKEQGGQCQRLGPLCGAEPLSDRQESRGSGASCLGSSSGLSLTSCVGYTIPLTLRVLLSKMGLIHFIHKVSRWI